MDQSKPHKLGAFVEGAGWVEHQYTGVFERETGWLVVAPDRGHIDLLLNLAGSLAPPFTLQYVLLVPQSREDGRYELTKPLAIHDLLELFARYREFFEEDGRHHLRVSASGVTLVYDQHNVLYLFGEIDRFADLLTSHGFTEGEVVLPSPHTHHYHEKYDVLVEDLMTRYEWKRSPLVAGQD